ncbi:MAG: PepSY-like domain-containing protein [Prevotella sp.]|nr:PepSY-like domain-containing protein [Prevotella sp.]
MKKIKFLAMALACLFTQSVTVMADDTPISPQKLPTIAQQFVKKYFPKNKIVYAEKDLTSYEARLDNGAKIEFDKKGNWDNVEYKMKGVPATLIPVKIATYVKKKFPNTAITKIDKERYGYEVELANDIELKFNKAGTLIGYDR